jgi:hypothetical protein
MNYYFLLLRNETIDFGSYTQEEMQRIMTDFDVWNSQMIAAGRLIVSASLQGGGGKTLRGGLVSDGPYSEAKEAVAGLLLIRAADYSQAVEIAAGCPFLARGGSVEVREAPQVDFEEVAIGIAEDHARARFAQKGA